MPRLTAFRSIPKSVLLLLLVTFESEAVDSACPTPASRPDISHPTQFRQLDPYSIFQTAPKYNAGSGLGFIDAVEENKHHLNDFWMIKVALPLWYAPDAAHPLGWLLQGHVFADTGVEALTWAGMVETDYYHTSFIVWEIQAEWFKLRLTNDLYAWTHRCHLESTMVGIERIEFVSWQTFFRQHWRNLHFLKLVPHILRMSPSVESKRVTTIGLDHNLVLLDIRGDWMEVEVEQPSPVHDRPKGPVFQHRGWVKWRDEQGPWVYIYTRD